MDLQYRDFSDLSSESDHNEIIRLLYGNTLATVSKLLEPHLKAVKEEAVRLCQLGLHKGTAVENDFASADSINSLLGLVSEMWDKTRFLRKAVNSIPRSASERGVAEAIVLHYKLHLDIYKQATLLKDALEKESEREKEEKCPGEDTKLMPLIITSRKLFDDFSCEDCHRLQARLLSTEYGIPEEKIFPDHVEPHCTAVTFLVPSQFTDNIIKCNTQLSTVWVLLELSIIEVSIPGVFTFSPSVGCFLTLLRGRKAFATDLLSVTEVRV